MDSDKQIGDAVIINYGYSGILRDCFVTAVKFSEGEVYYNVRICPFLDDEEWKEKSFLIENVKSFFVEYPEDRFTGKSNMPFIIE